LFDLAIVEKVAGNESEGFRILVPEHLDQVCTLRVTAMVGNQARVPVSEYACRLRTDSAGCPGEQYRALFEIRHSSSVRSLQLKRPDVPRRRF
jgi:hypothetical protein